jgi:type II secretory pathway component PulF
MSAEVFRYTARSHSGEPVAGALRAESRAAATLDLQRRSLFVTSLVPSQGSRLKAAAFFGHRRRALLAFFRAFSVLIRAGVSLRRALSVTVTHCSEKRLREALRAVLADVEYGSSLSTALARRPRDFSALQTAMIGAGEAGGVLDDVLERIADVLEHEHAVRKKVQTALVYPAVVAAAAAILILFLIVHVVPMFASLFARFTVPLPWPTRILLELGTTLGSIKSIPILVTAVAGLAAVSRLVRPRQIESLDRVRLKIPLIGVLLRYGALARLTRMLGVLLRSGVSVLTAIDVVAPVSGSRTYERGLRRVGDALRRGEGIHAAFQRNLSCDPLTLALIGVGEESGALDAMLIAAANYLDVEVEATLATLASILEPALIGVVGLIVGLIVFSIFLPLYGLIGSIT